MRDTSAPAPDHQQPGGPSDETSHPARAGLAAYDTVSESRDGTHRILAGAIVALALAWRAKQSTTEVALLLASGVLVTAETGLGYAGRTILDAAL